MSVDPAYFGLDDFAFPAASGGGAADYPDVSNVRKGIVYGNGIYVGTFTCYPNYPNLSNTFLHSPAQILRKLLVDLGLGSNVANNAAWPVFATTIPNAPDDAICVYDTAGVDHGREMVGYGRVERYGCQILVRGDTHASGFQKAQAIANAIDGNVLREQVSVVTNEGTATYFVNTIKRTNPVFSIGQDTPQSKRKLFTINLTAAIRRIT